MDIFNIIGQILKWLFGLLKRSKPNYPKHLYDKTRQDFIDKLNKK